VGPALARAVLVLLAAYHLGIGVTSLFSHRLTGRAAAALYAVSLDDVPQLRYAVKMLGLYALALGALLAVAARDPAGHAPTVAVVAALQAARAATRLANHALLRDAFGVPRHRNLAAVALLLAESGILAASLA